MPNPVRISQSIPTQNFLRNKNFYIGTIGDYGPTSTTGFYASITPPYEGYTLYESKSSQGPSIRVFENSSSLSTHLEQHFGHSFNFINEGIVSASLDDNIAVLNRDVLRVPSASTLNYYWDANLAPSSISGSTRIFSMGRSGSEGTMSSDLWTPTGQSGTSGSWAFNGSTNFISTDITSNDIFTSTFSVAMWVRIPSPKPDDILIDKSDGGGLSHNGFTINLNTINISGVDYAFWQVTIDGETINYTKTLASVFPYNTWSLLVWSFENRRDTFWLGQLGTPNEVTYTRTTQISNITATNALTFAKKLATNDDHLLGDIGMVALFQGKFDPGSVQQFYLNTKNYFFN